MSREGGSQPLPNQPPRSRSRVWTWVLALLLLALLVWVVGKRVEQQPHSEIGVSGEEAPPVKAPKTSPSNGLRAGSDARPTEPARAEPGGGGESLQESGVPASPAPRR